MSLTETRILSMAAFRAEYAIVSMPRTAWYWLDDLVNRQFDGGYEGLLELFKDSKNSRMLCQMLRDRAEAHCEARMARLYNLANDNTPEEGAVARKQCATCPFSPDLSRKMPSVYRLFHFMPHATYLTTIWERRNYHLNQDNS